MSDQKYKCRNMANQKVPSPEVDSHRPEHATVADKKQTPLKIIRYMFNRLSVIDIPEPKGSAVVRRLGVCFAL